MYHEEVASGKLRFAQSTAKALSRHPGLNSADRKTFAGAARQLARGKVPKVQTQLAVPGQPVQVHHPKTVSAAQASRAGRSAAAKSGRLREGQLSRLKDAKTEHAVKVGKHGGHFYEKFGRKVYVKG